MSNKQEVLAGRRAYASSTVIDLDAVTRVAADADLSDADAVRSLVAFGQRPEPWPDPGPDRLTIPGGRHVERRPLGAHRISTPASLPRELGSD